MIYETKNLTLEQVSELYETTSKAWKSKRKLPNRVTVRDICSAC